MCLCACMCVCVCMCVYMCVWCVFCTRLNYFDQESTWSSEFWHRRMTEFRLSLATSSSTSVLSRISTVPLPRELESTTLPFHCDPMQSSQRFQWMPGDHLSDDAVGTFLLSSKPQERPGVCVRCVCPHVFFTCVCKCVCVHVCVSVCVCAYICVCDVYSAQGWTILIRRVPEVLNSDTDTQCDVHWLCLLLLSYLDDIPHIEGELYAALVMSTYARAKISVNAS